MAGRPEKRRKVQLVPEYTGFAPVGVPAGCCWRIELAADELEVLRILDYEGRSQKEAAASLGVSRATIASIAASAHRKVADALVNGKTIEVVRGAANFEGEPEVSWTGKEGNIMRIAATYSDGEIFPHFGRAEQFKLYDIEDGEVKRSEVVSSNGVSHGALAGLLAQGGVDVLICGGIGGGALAALASQGIRVVPGASGSADEAVKAFLAGTLTPSAAPTCGAHHHEGGHCGEGGHCCH